MQPPCNIAELVPAPNDETFTESAAAPQPLAPPSSYLIMVLECERPLSGSSRHGLREVTEVTIGRGEERAAARVGERLLLTVPGRWMSTAHIQIRREGERWLLEDLTSRNGTRVNGQSVVHKALDDGDLIEAGHSIFLFRDALHAPPNAAMDLDTSHAEFGVRGLATVIPALADEVRALAKIAGSAVPVLIRGETGTGKELAARAVHALSMRSGSFVAINCGALSVSLLESQLFGHVKGAFSGAVRDEPGFVRASAGGTLFLDEVGDLPAPSQAALLRVLQEGEVVPVGATRGMAVDLRVVAATHQPLEALVAKGTFRADLLARLDGFSFALPPLRERREDIGLIVGELLRTIPDLPPDLAMSWEAGGALLRYGWPLNTRELRHCLARACALRGDTARLELVHFPPQVRAAFSPDAAESVAPDSGARLKAQLESLLAEHRGDIAQVARALGKARMQIYRWCKRLAIDPERYRR